MKKGIVALIVLAILSLGLGGCSDNLVVNGEKYQTYGLVNKDDVKKERMNYKPVWGNIIWGCLTFSTVIGPVYFFGFDMFEPVALKQN